MDRVDRHWKARRRQWQLTLAATLALLAGCASNPPAPVEDRTIDDVGIANRRVDTVHNDEMDTSGGYRVVAGDTLYSIAFRNGVDFRDIARWNRIEAPYRIYAGQRLRLAAAEQSAGVTVAPVNGGDHAAVVTPLPVESPHRPPAVAPPPTIASKTATPPSNELVKPAAATKPPLPNSAAAATLPPVIATGSVVPPPMPESGKDPAVPATTAAVVTPTKPGALAPGVNTVAVAAPGPSAATLSSGGITWRWPASGKVIGTFVGGDQTRQGVDIAGSAGTPVFAAADGSVVYSGNGLLGYGELVIVKHSASFLSAYGHNRRRLVKEGDAVKAGQPIAEMGASAANRDMLHFEIRRNGKPVNPLEYLPAH